MFVVIIIDISGSRFQRCLRLHISQRPLENCRFRFPLTTKNPDTETKNKTAKSVQQHLNNAELVTNEVVQTEHAAFINWCGLFDVSLCFTFTAHPAGVFDSHVV